MRHSFDGYAFHLEHFDELLNGEQSWALLYLPARACPCRDRATGSPQPTCPRCRGYGFTWEPPPRVEWTLTFHRGSAARPEALPRHLRPEEVMAVWDEEGRSYAIALEDGQIRFVGEAPPEGAAYHVRVRAPMVVRGHGQNLAGRKEVGEYGELDHRDLSLTLPARTRLPDGRYVANPAFFAAYPDRFVLVDARVRVSQVLYRGEEEHLLYAYVYQVLGCEALDAQFRPSAYAPGEDFTLEGGRVVWTPGRGPRMGTPYTLTYIAAPEFYVFRELPQVRHQGGYSLPRRLHLRVWELFPRPGAAYGR
ncbi:hypothetical protein [Thermus brockianus]